ncbi:MULTISPECIES: enoyl-CoA hydratase/isomerase family protein [Pseudonocardia]|uniref:2,3-dehydroadipyl-CoA hydratase n=2 Tax=Pseudonocardia TaxID=1847 RepID=A0A1Y2NAX7_PSEAH|nr:MULTISPECIES: enoyl-CoA hydratase/isomerase family protein [Pseudonocardia]OSY44237.1 2,3-dehydroadipyl-CoA hydratase [Pseudonocardia autotrophica]TDN74033.1 enoyl-CoA hydratase/carnithine racemase [Pseudonocardia autotrophica]BBG04790.1 enoyl-CoA hydratase [Pseudonocardia autotrophica]GEC23446.1 enoyl-CoA hydratase [Pseudonocardia saturnea]
MTQDDVRFEIRGSAAWITLNRPERRNALSVELLDGVATALRTAEGDRAVRSVVFAGTGPMFCAGADLTRVLDELGGAGVTDFLRRAAGLFDQVARHPKPVIAAVHGGVVAGGLELVLACDLVLAARGATFADGHARYGMFPAAGGATRLPRRIGANRAKQLLFTAEGWSAQRMYEAGLVTEVVDDDRLAAAAQQLADRIGRLSPLGLARIKDVVDTGLERSLEDALAYELAACAEYTGSRDFAEGLRAFAARREPEFVGE